MIMTTKNLQYIRKREIKFGKIRGTLFESSINTIYQSFQKKKLYPSIEEKTANLLYFLIKNHPFVDGNKRIAAAQFIWYLAKITCYIKKTGQNE